MNINYRWDEKLRGGHFSGTRYKGIHSDVASRLANCVFLPVLVGVDSPMHFLRPRITHAVLSRCSS